MTRRAFDRRWLWPLLAVSLLILAAWRFATLPLFVDYPAQGSRQNLVAVLVSGDSGLDTGLGHRIAERFAAAGVQVVGINSPAFFRTERDAPQITGLIGEAARRVLQGRPAARLVLIGQSFGADILPIAVNRLPPQLRARLALIALVVPTRTVYRQISFAEYFELGAPDEIAVGEARRVTGVPLLCVHGEQERASLCPLLYGNNLTSVVLPGGHPLSCDANRLFAVLWSTIRAVTKPGGSKPA